MTTRAGILAALKTALEQITKANGFQTDVRTVRRGAYAPDRMSPRPAICVYSLEREQQDLTGGDAESIMSVGIDGWMDLRDEDFAPLDNFAADAQALLMSQTRNPYRTETSIKKVLYLEMVTERTVGFAMEVEVKYEHTLEAA